VVWPLYELEDAQDSVTLLATALPMAGAPDEPPLTTPFEEILVLLHECGITDIKHPTERFAMEFCDDCGAPLYCDPEAELVHAEMPEDVAPGPGHFH
jgi:Protein of unknown function (DUF2863)